MLKKIVAKFTQFTSYLALVFCVMAGHAFAADKLVPGDKPPASLGQTRDGESIETTQYAGKVLVVTFWASWCGPCKKELPVLEGIQRIGGKDRIQVVAVNIEDSDQFRKVAKALASLTLTLTHDYRKKSSEAYGVHGIPHMVIIGRDGKIVNVHRGYSEDALDSIVAEINTALAACEVNTADADTKDCKKTGA